MSTFAARVSFPGGFTLSARINCTKSSAASAPIFFIRAGSTVAEGSPFGNRSAAVAANCELLNLAPKSLGDDVEDREDDGGSHESAHDEFHAEEAAPLLLRRTFRIWRLTPWNDGRVETAEAAAWVARISLPLCGHAASYCSAAESSARFSRFPVVIAPSEALLTSAAYLA